MQVLSAGHIYLVDDDASIRSALAGTLERQGFSVTPYASAAEFLQHATPVSPAVILLDMRMPGLSGVECQADLERHGWTTPIIFISGESLPAQIVQAMKQGASDFLLKPFSMQTLLVAVERAIERDRATHALSKMQVESAAELIALTSDIDISALRLRSLDVKHPLAPERHH